MAEIIKIGILEQSQGGNFSADANERRLTYQAVYDLPENVDNVLLNELVPKIGDAYPYNSTLKCGALSVTAPGKVMSKIWEIEVFYSSQALKIEEGLAYDFRAVPIIKNEVASGAYWVFNPALETEEQKERLSTPSYPIQMSSGKPPSSGIEKTTVNTAYRWWQIESKKSVEDFDDGSIYQNIGKINADSVVIAGIVFNPYTIVIKNIQPEIYFFTPPGSTESERRYKTYYTIEKFLPNTAIQVQDQDIYALLPPIADPEATEENKIVRRITLADLPENSGKISLASEENEEIDKPVLLDGKGAIKDTSEDDTAVNLQFEVKEAIEINKELNLAEVNAYASDAAEAN